MTTTIKNFHFSCPAEIFFGQNCVTENAAIFTQYGKKAFILTSVFPDGYKNLALEDTEKLLKNNGIQYRINDNVICDPSVESCIDIMADVKDFNPDFIIGVGGGSTMDTVKGINVMLAYPELEPYDALFNNGAHVFGVGGKNHGALPFISIPTTAGTGADVTGVAVLTRADIDNKCGTNRRNYANYNFTDPRYIMGIPKELNHSVAVDALCHGIEAYLSRGSQDNHMTNSMAETAFSLFAGFKDHLLADTMTEDDCTKQALHSLLQGMVIINEVTGVPHGLGYPLSHHYHVPHGLACGVFEGEYLREFKEPQNQARVEKLIKLIGFDHVDAFCDYIQTILAPHINIKVTRKEIDEWTQVFCDQQWRVDRHPEPLTAETVKGMYERALTSFIVD